MLSKGLFLHSFRRSCKSFVQLADGAGTDSASPESLGDILYSTHGNNCQIHFDQRFLDRTLSPPIPLDDGSLEKQIPEFGHLQRHFAGCRLQASRVMTCSSAGSISIAFITPCLTKLVSLSFQQTVRLRHRYHRPYEQGEGHKPPLSHQRLYRHCRQNAKGGIPA